MIASLGMYDPPWLQAANDALWRIIADKLRSAGLADAPRALTRGKDLHDLWRSPDLLIGQTCGYPLVTELVGRVILIATPCYDAEGCDGAYHRAAILVRADDPATSMADLRGRRVGVNDLRSNSGMNLLRATVAPLAGGHPFFGSTHMTGGHAASFAALLTGAIDVASIDCVTLAQLKARHPRQAERLRILAWTEATPGLPLVMSALLSEHLAVVRSALEQTSRDPMAKPVLGALGITGFSTMEWRDYAIVEAVERRAAEQGYAQLA